MSREGSRTAGAASSNRDGPSRAGEGDSDAQAERTAVVDGDRSGVRRCGVVVEQARVVEARDDVREAGRSAVTDRGGGLKPLDEASLLGRQCRSAPRGDRKPTWTVPSPPREHARARVEVSLPPAWHHVGVRNGAIHRLDHLAVEAAGLTPGGLGTTKAGHPRVPGLDVW